METVKRVSRNLFFQGISEFTTKVLQIIVLIYIARFLKETEFGKFNFAVAFTALSIIFIDLGLQPLFVRELSRKKELAEKYIFHGAIIKTAVSALAFLAVIAIMNILSYPSDIKAVVYIMFLSAVFRSFTDTLSSVFLAFEEMQWDSLLKIAKAAVLTASVLFALVKGYGLTVIAWIYLFAEIFVFVLCLIILFTRFIKFTAKFEKGLIAGLTVEAIPFALTVLFYSIYFYIDSVMLSKMRGVYEVGIYGAAYTLTIALISIPAVYTNAIFPSLAKFHLSSKESLKFAYEKSVFYMSIIALPIVSVLFFAAGNIIHFLYSSGYGKSVLVLKIVAITVFFRFITFVNGITIISIDRQRQRLYSQGITALINIGLNFVLIPYYGYIGAAVATVATELFLFLSYFSLAGSHFNNLGRIAVASIKPIAAIILASAIFFLNMNAVVEIILVLAVYSALLLLLKAFKKDDWDIFKNVLNKNPLKK